MTLSLTTNLKDSALPLITTKDHHNHKNILKCSHRGQYPLWVVVSVIHSETILFLSSPFTCHSSVQAKTKQFGASMNTSRIQCKIHSYSQHPQLNGGIVEYVAYLGSIISNDRRIPDIRTGLGNIQCSFTLLTTGPDLKFLQNCDTGDETDRLGSATCGPGPNAMERALNSLVTHRKKRNIRWELEVMN